MYKYYVHTAVMNKDTIDVIPNKTLRYVVNPYYDYTGVLYEQRHALQREIINRAIGLEKRNVMYYPFFAKVTKIEGEEVHYNIVKDGKVTPFKNSIKSFEKMFFFIDVDPSIESLYISLFVFSKYKLLIILESCNFFRDFL